GGRAGSAAAVASACRCGDVAAGDAEAGGVFVGGLEDRQQLAGGLVGGAVVFEDAAAGDGEGGLVLARSRWSRWEGGGGGGGGGGRGEAVGANRWWGRRGRARETGAGRGGAQGCQHGLLGDVVDVGDGAAGNPRGEQDAPVVGGHPGQVGGRGSGVRGEAHPEHRHHDVGAVVGGGERPPPAGPEGT